MAEKLLERSDILAAFQQMRREWMAGGSFRDLDDMLLKRRHSLAAKMVMHPLHHLFRRQAAGRQAAPAPEGACMTSLG